MRLNTLKPLHLAVTLALLIFISQGTAGMKAWADVKSDLDAANEAASAASSAYDEAVARQAEIQGQIDDHAANLAELESVLPEKKAEFEKSLVDEYKNMASPAEIIVNMMSGNSLSDVMAISDAYQRISSHKYVAYNELCLTQQALNDAKAQLEATKVEQDAVVEQARLAKQDALDKQEAARAAWNAANATAASFGTTRRAPTSTVAFDEESAKAWIVKKESGGNYNARNGRYIGAYQLTDSYLGGDYSPENQDRVAQQYVERRYGSWMNAVAFWQSHGWY